MERLYNFHVYDKNFTSLGRCEAESADAVLDEYPEAWYFLNIDYVSRK